MLQILGASVKIAKFQAVLEIQKKLFLGAGVE